MRYIKILGGSIRLILCAALVLFLTAAVTPRSTAWAQSSSSDANSVPSGQTATMVAPIGPSDMLHIDVVDQPDLSRDYQVDANGDITMLYVGKLHVGGLTPEQATNVVKNALGKIYVNPIVTINRASMGGYSITVTGSVQRQGSQVVRRDARLNDIIQVALPSDSADLTRIQITRGLPGQVHQTLTYNLSTFLSTGDTSNNPQLSDGDVIFVPNKAPVTNSVSVVGAITKPGRYDVQPNTTVFDLITLAGGLDQSADRTGIYIQPVGTLDRRSFNYDQARQTPQSQDVNPLLKDGDKVVVPEVQNIPVFSITGGVLKPGQYPIRGKLSLADAEGLAGGVADRAKVDQITVTREAASGAQVLKVNAKDPSIAANFVLQPGDNVFIPQGSPPSRIDPLQAFGILIALFGIFHR